jgi:hypothetical protein
MLYMERQPLSPSLPDVGDAGDFVYIFSNILAAAAAEIARSSQLSSPMPRHAVDVMAGGGGADRPQSRIYKEYHSVQYVPSSALGLSQPLSRQRVCPSPQNQVRGWGRPNSDDRRKSLALCLLC